VNIQNVNHGDLIRQTREKLQMTQQQLATELGVSQPAISRMENAKPGELTAAEIVALCRVLGLTWADFEPEDAA
jgi:transcriptional regulator with XRE-family HTH domain